MKDSTGNSGERAPRSLALAPIGVLTAFVGTLSDPNEVRTASAGSRWTGFISQRGLYAPIGSEGRKRQCGRERHSKAVSLLDCGESRDPLEAIVLTRAGSEPLFQRAQSRERQRPIKR